jgi:hypothetical protein
MRKNTKFLLALLYDQKMGNERFWTEWL